MPDEPVFKVTNKMFEMLSDWQNKLEDGTVKDPSVESEASPESQPADKSSDKSENTEETH
jgi:hypothetical protein